MDLDAANAARAQAAEGREDVMATPVVMPQMGESIAEGTIVRWIKKVGDSVDRDEPLFEISTDKVDAEIPSPAAGTLIEIAVKEGETVPVNSVVATIGAAGEKGVAAAPPATEAPAPSGQTAMHTSQADGSAATSVTSPPPAPVRPQSGTASAPSESSAPPRTNGREAAPAPDGRQKSSPLVRRIAKEHNVDLGQIEGTGIAGRVTKNDILSYLDRGGAPPLMAQAPAGSGGPTAPAVPRPPGELRSTRSRPDVGDAKADRRAHDSQPTNVGACLLGVRDQLQQGRRNPQGSSSGLRTARRQADLYIVHCQGRHRLLAPPQSDQRLHRWR